jgi:hypothetical protein
MLLLAAMQGLIRADIAFTVHVGLVLACLIASDRHLAVGRKLQAATSMFALLLAGGIQFYLMHAVYPHATYGKSALIEIKENLTNPLGMVAVVLFMIPCAWLAVRLLTARRMPDAANFGLLLGAAVYFLMWFTVGRLEEVRIFLPYAVALIPLTVECAMRYFAEADNGEADKPQMVDSQIS